MLLVQMHLAQRAACQFTCLRHFAARAHPARAGANARRKGVAGSSAALPEQLILGIESSCDDTGVAVVTSGGRILGEALASQADIHAQWGGVVPKLAQQAHEAAIDACVADALAAAGVAPRDLSAVAVTIGPGLSLCLRVGVTKARQVAATHGLPMVPVHHMEAHALVARMGGVAGTSPQVQFPFLCLLVSGGHNLLVVVEGVGRYVQLGSTLDDAIGEAYDKVARLLGLELKPSGGAALEALAKEGNPRAFPFTRPMQRRRTCDFSYAGLKTAVRLLIEDRLGPVTGAAGGGDPSHALTHRQLRADIAASFQHVAVGHLEDRCRRGLEWASETHPGLRQLVVAGGVAANATVRARLAEVTGDAGVELVCPPPQLCTDNGVMVAWAGAEHLSLGVGVEPPPLTAALAEGEWLDLRPRWPLTDRKDARAFVALRSAKKKRMFTSLEVLTQGQGGEAGATLTETEVS